MKKAFFLLAFLIIAVLAQGRMLDKYVDVGDVEAIIFRGARIDIDGNAMPHWANVLCFYKENHFFDRFNAPGSNDTHRAEQNMACVSNVVNATHIVTRGVVRCVFAPITDERVESTATMLRDSCSVSAWSSALTDVLTTHELDAPVFDSLYRAVHMGAFMYGALYESKLRELGISSSAEEWPDVFCQNAVETGDCDDTVVLLYTTAWGRITAFFGNVVQQMIDDVHVMEQGAKEKAGVARPYTGKENQAFVRFMFTVITSIFLAGAVAIVLACASYAAVNHLASSVTKTLACMWVALASVMMIAWCATCAPSIS